jgi:hypothetical protein
VLAYLRPELMADESSIEMNNLAMVGAISFAIVVLILIWMKRRSRTVYPDVYANDNVPVKDHPF